MGVEHACVWAGETSKKEWSVVADNFAYVESCSFSGDLNQI